MNTGASWPSLDEANARVLEIQTKLHRWAGDNEDRRFDDLFNLMCDPAFVLVAWSRVRTNKGSHTAGVDGETARYIDSRRGVEEFLSDLRAVLKARTFTPQPIRERMIPKPGSRKQRRLGIPTVRDRVVQAALKLVLEPIFEAGFKTCSRVPTEATCSGRHRRDPLPRIPLLRVGVRGGYRGVLRSHRPHSTHGPCATTHR